MKIISYLAVAGVAFALTGYAAAQMPSQQTETSAPAKPAEQAGNSVDRSKAASAVKELSRINDELRHADSFGGHREAAMKDISAAIDELREAEKMEAGAK